ncbi:MAG: hypothetical protein M3506_09425 [Chloroflexota bacterium]|nr:hypothetical protein [Chloroflexota bacterium]
MLKITNPANQPGWEERGVWREKLEQDRAWRDRGWVRCEDPACERPLAVFTPAAHAIPNARHTGCRMRCQGPGCDGLFMPYGKGRYCSDECRRHAISRQRFLRRNRGTVCDRGAL